jgi:hypothetical protein
VNAGLATMHAPRVTRRERRRFEVAEPEVERLALGAKLGVGVATSASFASVRRERRS